MRKGKRITAVLLTMAMIIGSFATNPYMAEAKSKKAVKSVSISNVDSKTLVLKKGQKYKLKAKVKVTGGASKKVTWKSSKSKIVSVSSKGVLKAKKKGTAKITVKSKANSKKKATLTVKVGTPVKKINLAQKQLKVTVGKTVKIKATVSPGKPTVKKLSYSVNNKKIATVNKSGVVKGVAKGTAKVTVKATDGSKKKAVATIEVVEEQGKTTVQPKPTTPNQPKPTQPTNPDDTDKIVYTEADLKWEDDFEGTSLNTKYWNVEAHDPGWVNNESQKYVSEEENKTTQNITVKDGYLTIQARKDTDANGNTTYTSGRINTQNKQNFQYGKFEARIKVPYGNAFLPAFWMMPADESLYGQWPKCGEIDIMEVLGGKDTKTSYSTLHFGEPHTESQGTYKLKDGVKDFAEDFHVYACEWDPGEIRFYVDGKLFYKTSDWFSKKQGFGEVAYPAPYDQPFYIILNLAVGGSWPGKPDAEKEFGDNAQMVVDYVKVYQKENYDTNVEKPEKEPVKLREPDATGNYVMNGDFSAPESFADEENWYLHLENDGKATAAIENGMLVIAPEEIGAQNHSIQFLQPDVPLEQGYEYKLSFKAYADEARTMLVDMPNIQTWSRYLADTEVSLTTKQQTFEYTFDMTSPSDAQSRIEFNFGNNQSTAKVYIDDVRLEKVGEIEIPDETNSVLPDGNYVYNGDFSQGKNRLDYWTVEEGSKVSVTNEKNVRELKVVVGSAPVTVKQDIAITGGKKYKIMFDVHTEGEGCSMKAEVAGKTFTPESLTDTKQTYTDTFEAGTNVNGSELVLTFDKPGTYYVDNVRIQEDALLLNGDFSAGTTGYEIYVDGSAKASGSIDSLNQEGVTAFAMDIENTGDKDWKIQLKQSGIKLEKGKCYSLSLEAKSTKDRKITYAIQRDGSVHKNANGDEDWTPYVQETVDLTSQYQKFESKFKMTEDTDEGSIFNIAMGAVGDTQITDKHTVYIDNIVLEEIDESELPKPEIPDVPVGENMLTNADFADGEEGWNNNKDGATVTTEKGSITFDITEIKDNPWDVQLKKENLTFEKGSNYKLIFDVLSEKDRQITVGAMDANSSEGKWYITDNNIFALTSGVKQTCEVNISVGNNDTDNTAYIAIQLGKQSDTDDTPTGKVTISNLKLVKLGSATEEGENLLKNPEFSDNASGWYTGTTEGTTATPDPENKAIKFDITNVGSNPWDVQLKQAGLTFETGSSYKLTFDVVSTQTRKITISAQHEDENPSGWYIVGDNMPELTANEKKSVTIGISIGESATDTNAYIAIQLGKVKIDEKEVDTPTSEVTISNIRLVKVPAATQK